MGVESGEEVIYPLSFLEQENTISVGHRPQESAGKNASGFNSRRPIVCVFECRSCMRRARAAIL